MCVTYLPSSRAAVSFVHLLLLWLLAIIEGGGFTYCSSASCCKAVRSSCFSFRLQGHIVKLEMASNFTRILSNENMSPNSIALATQNDFRQLSNRLECHKVLRLPRKMTWQPAWTPSKKRGFAASPRHGEATGKRETRDETRGSIKTSISRETSSDFDTV